MNTLVIRHIFILSAIISLILTLVIITFIMFLANNRRQVSESIYVIQPGESIENSLPVRILIEF